MAQLNREHDQQRGLRQLHDVGGGIWAENFSKLERAETKLPSDDVRRRRRRNERKRRVWKLLPDRKIFRSDSEPSESEHVSARFSHSSGLCPCDLIDGQSFPLRL